MSCIRGKNGSEDIALALYQKDFRSLEANHTGARHLAHGSSKLHQALAIKILLVHKLSRGIHLHAVRGKSCCRTCLVSSKGGQNRRKGSAACRAYSKTGIEQGVKGLYDTTVNLRIPPRKKRSIDIAQHKFDGHTFPLDANCTNAMRNSSAHRSPKQRTACCES